MLRGACVHAHVQFVHGAEGSAASSVDADSYQPPGGARALWHVCDPRRLRSLYLSTIPGGIAALPASIQIASAMVPPCAPCEVGEVSEVRAGGGCARGHAGWLRKEEVPTRERGAGDRPTSSTTRHCGSAEPVTSSAIRFAMTGGCLFAPLKLDHAM